MRTEWDPGLETGNELVDAQHRALFDLFAELSDAERSSQDPRGQVLEALERLTEYVIVHFSAEESLMEQSAYPSDAAESHRHEHRYGTERTRELVLSYHEGELVSVEPIVSFLCGWLAVHISGSDRELVRHLRGEAA